jgi:hypothetical protein
MNTRHVGKWPSSMYMLSSAITAFEVFTNHLHVERLGPVCELPKGADLEICGDGFNERTVRMRCGDGQYFVYWRDLDSARPAKTVESSEEEAARYAVVASTE